MRRGDCLVYKYWWGGKIPMFAFGILNYGVELEVVKGLVFALLCFALLWGLASFVVAAVYCSAGVREAEFQSRSISQAQWQCQHER